jgi:hypothetical protein
LQRLQRDHVLVEAVVRRLKPDGVVRTLKVLRLKRGDVLVEVDRLLLEGGRFVAQRPVGVDGVVVLVVYDDFAPGPKDRKMIERISMVLPIMLILALFSLSASVVCRRSRCLF